MSRLTTSEWWNRTIQIVANDADFIQLSKHLQPIEVRFEVDAFQINLLFHQGTLHRADHNNHHLTVTGRHEVWEDLVAGKTVWGQATNVHLGKLAVQGDALAGVWLTRPIWQFWRVTRAHQL
ncbi:hypothetical protein [Pollutimonas bauzanensis]|uniref:SCP-2 sterol transfer family protein n=1 Tax=Pollutimonas bauzanensis TaxID=658167 RepID=A0A1M5ZE17_9BURK|nr:hypothetical protein [Pollutimonas bauzanensis]SHI22446.1 hypothetical protein SAMN04488135_11418 [Pollutimonas bauzanensis]